MNDTGKRKKQPLKEAKELKKANEREELYSTIGLYAQTLAGKINLRLLLAEDIPGADRIMFVESITVTDIWFIEKTKEQGILAGVRQWMRQISDAVKQLFVRRKSRT